MKLLRDFFRLRVSRRSLSAARDARRRVYVVTVPAPLASSAEPQRQPEARIVAPLSPPCHLQLASSH